jgi:O-antigen ligase
MQLNLEKKLLMSNGIHFSIVILILVLPFSIRLTSFLIIGIALFWLLLILFCRQKININLPSFLTLTNLFFLSVLSLIYSTDIEKGLFTIEKQVSMLFFPILFSTLIIKSYQITTYLKTFILSCVLASSVCLFYSFYLISKLYKFQNIDFAHLSFRMPEIISFNAPYFSMYIYFSLLIIINIIFKRNYKNFFSLLLYIFLFIYLFFISTALSSRTSLFSFICIVFIFGLSYLFLKKKIILSFIFIFSILTVLIASYHFTPYLKRKFDNVIINGIENEPRFYIYKASVEVIKRNIFVGVGVGDIEDSLIKEYKKLNFKEGIIYKYNPHSQYIHTTMALGLLGLAFLLFLFTRSINKSLKTKNYLYLSFLLLFMLCCVTESMLSVQKGIVFFSFFNSLFYLQKQFQ